MSNETMNKCRNEECHIKRQKEKYKNYYAHVTHRIAACVTLEKFYLENFFVLIAKLNYSHDVHRHTYIIFFILYSASISMHAPSCLFI